MKGKQVFVLILQFILVLVFLGAVLFIVKRENNPTTIYVYAEDMLANADITRASLVEKTVPKSALNDGADYITPSNIDEIFEGKEMITVCKVFAKQNAYVSQLTESEKADPFANLDLTQYRKVSIAAGYSDVFGGEIARGDYVDLVEVVTDKSTNQITSTAFMSNVLVYSITSSDGSLYVSKITDESLDASSRYSDGTITDYEKANGSVGTVTLLVTPEQAVIIEAKKKASNTSISFLGKFSQEGVTTESYTIYQ